MDVSAVVDLDLDLDLGMDVDLCLPSHRWLIVAVNGLSLPRMQKFMSIFASW